MQTWVSVRPTKKSASVSGLFVVIWFTFSSAHIGDTYVVQSTILKKEEVDHG